MPQQEPVVQATTVQQDRRNEDHQHISAHQDTTVRLEVQKKLHVPPESTRTCLDRYAVMTMTDKTLSRHKAVVLQSVPKHLFHELFKKMKIHLTHCNLKAC